MNSHSDNTVRATWTGPPESDVRLPETADVVIIGGGIVGVSTAWFLAREGVKVVVCEKGHIAGEQSGRNWGWVRVQGRDPREIPMMLESMAIWRTLAHDIGEPVGYTEGGCLFTARDEKEAAELEAWCKVGQDHGLSTRLLSSQELSTHVGAAAEHWCAALYTATDGRAEPHLAAPAIARAAARAGATVATGCAVRGLRQEAGKVAAVVTERGEIRTSTVLCAAGAWSSMFCRSLDIDLPQLKVRGTVARTAPVDLDLNGNLFDSKVGIRRRQDGGYTVAHGSILDHSITPSTLRYSRKFLPALRYEWNVLRVRLNGDFFRELRQPSRWPLNKPSPFERERVLNPKPNESQLKELRENLARLWPELTDVPLVESWAGMVETTPDVVPVIGAEESLPGFYIATGFSGHGFGLGPGAGKSIAGLLGGRSTGIDLTPFRRQRFYDGSPIKPYTAL